MRGYHGKDCTDKCSHGCADSLCLFNGTCTHGCESEKYIGDNCSVPDGINDITGENTVHVIGNYVYVHLSSINWSSFK